VHDLVIRRLVRDDVPAYHALRQRGLAEHPEAFTSSAEEEAGSMDKAAARLAGDASKDVVLGAFEGDRLVGVVGIHVDPRMKARHRGHVYGMYVARECARRGIGARLLDALVAQACASRSLDALVLTVTAANEAAYGLYERAGFTRFGLEPGAVRVAGRSYDKVHMIRWLDAQSRAS